MWGKVGPSFSAGKNIDWTNLCVKQQNTMRIEHHYAKSTPLPGIIQARPPKSILTGYLYSIHCSTIHSDQL